MDQGTFPVPRITPWVARLLIIMVGVQLLRATIITSPAATALLQFDPALGLSRPWTVLTYAFVHGGLFHLLGNGLTLFVFGPTVERRLGGPGFLLYFLYCVVGAAALALAVNGLTPVAPFIGASGGVMGVLLAYAMIHPDREILSFPIPVPIQARTLVLLLAIFDLAGVLFLRRLIHTGIAHEAHLGGLAFGWIFFRLQGVGRKPFEVTSPPRSVPQTAAVGGRTTRKSPPAGVARPMAVDKTQAELDRVLDKISATGMNSLTAGEKKFLDEVAKKKNEH